MALIDADGFQVVVTGQEEDTLIVEAGGMVREELPGGVTLVTTEDDTGIVAPGEEFRGIPYARLLEDFERPAS